MKGLCFLVALVTLDTLFATSYFRDDQKNIATTRDVVLSFLM